GGFFGAVLEKVREGEKGNEDEGGLKIEMEDGVGGVGGEKEDIKGIEVNGECGDGKEEVDIWEGGCKKVKEGFLW
ncbi:hypothetical protein, partial [Neisseria sicca]|uniref:hypothetical protein n=1 Tax=Neisseria sicca TaxID=490 RepID=UPI001C996311